MTEDGVSAADLSVYLMSVQGEPPRLWERRGSTDVNGKLELANLAPDEYTLCVSRGSYQLIRKCVISDTSGAAVKVDLSSAGRVCGRVLVHPGSDGSPCNVILRRVLPDGFTVCADGGSSRPGHFSFDGLDAGTYEIHGPSVDNASFRLGEVTVGPGQTVEHDVTIGVPRIVGRVLDAQSGSAIQGVRVLSIRAPRVETHTDQNGAFVLHDLPVGDYWLIFRIDGYEKPKSTRVQVKDLDEPVSVPIRLSQEACLRVTAVQNDGSAYAGRLRLVLYPSETDKLSVGGGVMNCDSDGRGSRSGLKPGKYWAEFLGSEGMLLAGMWIDLASGDANNIVVSLNSD
ncbi:MAG: carboxypeptidase-like regulatory domain-containing protein [Planctomycetota bacterium]